MGAPLTALSCVSVTLAGNVVIGGGATFLAGGALRSVATLGAGGLARFSSWELQLEIPKAANSESTSTVEAMRAGVHNGFPVFGLFIAGMSYL
jgi:hypothetical protein